MNGSALPARSRMTRARSLKSCSSIKTLIAETFDSRRLISNQAVEFGNDSITLSTSRVEPI